MTEAVVRLAGNSLNACSVEKMPHHKQDLLGPQHDLLVAHLSREIHALGHQSAPDAQASRFALHEQQPEFGGRHILGDQEDTANSLSIPLGDPATLPWGIELAEELNRDLGHQRLEFLIPAVLLGVQLTVPLHDPTHVTNP